MIDAYINFKQHKTSLSVLHTVYSIQCVSAKLLLLSRFIDTVGSTVGSFLDRTYLCSKQEIITRVCVLIIELKHFRASDNTV